MNTVKKKRTLAELSTEELVEKRQEIQFIGSQYAMSGCETPPQLTTEWEAVEQELANRRENP